MYLIVLLDNISIFIQKLLFKSMHKFKEENKNKLKSKNYYKKIIKIKIVTNFIKNRYKIKNKPLELEFKLL